MSELRVPTMALTAEVLCADGRVLRGRIFVSALASKHTGPMRAEEWINDPAPFFPFLPDDTSVAVLLNKLEVLAVTVPAFADYGDEGEASEPARSVIFECGERRIAGILVIDMASTQRRVLDYLNRPESFVTLRDGDQHHLVHKRRITRVLETREE